MHADCVPLIVRVSETCENNVSKPSTHSSFKSLVICDSLTDLANTRVEMLKSAELPSKQEKMHFSNGNLCS